jgi:hypothetical protein
MANVNTYNPSDVYLVICGEQCESWQTITVERNTPEAFKFVKGIGRKNTRVRDKNSAAKITITVMQTSELNDLLSEVHAQDLENGTGRLDVMLVDRSGTTLIQSIEAYIVGYPTKEFSDAVGFIPWVIQCQTTEDYIVGGNTQPSSPLLAEALRKLGIR